METRVVNNIPEWRYQAEVIARLHKLEDEGLPIACAGDMNRAKRSRRERMEAKVTGLTAGEPDVRVYVTGGRPISIELKTPNGRLSARSAMVAVVTRLAAFSFSPTDRLAVRKSIRWSAAG
jgi:hypothetical protein